MKRISLRVIKLVALLTITFGIVLFVKDNFAHLLNLRVDAAGALKFNLGVPNGRPIFTFNSFSPGDSTSKTVKANNGDSVTRIASVKGIKTFPGSLDQALTIEITHNGQILYGPKTLPEFFIDSESVNGVVLSSINAGDKAEYDFRITFAQNSGNEYQNQHVSFDLLFGIITDIPAVCDGIKFDKVIYGTAGNDKLKGTSGNDLIIGFEGNDTIDGGIGDDCIIGGAGNDKLSGGIGDDIIDGGDGNDDIQGGVGDDYLIGGNGNDKMDGGVGDDTMFGNDGNDKISGGVGDDKLYGGPGNDTLEGDVGNDFLDGQEGIDKADGAVGIDTCIAENTKRCER